MHDRARQPPRHLSGAHPAGRGDEPVPLRHGRRAGLSLRARRRAAVPTTRRASPGRCSTASTSGSRCRRSRPSDLIRPGRPSRALRWRRAWRAARTIQRERFERLGVTSASHQCALPAGADRGDRRARRGRADACCSDASEKLGFSARAYHRVLKVARTLADLDAARDGRPHPSRRGDFLPHEFGAHGAGGVNRSSRVAL